MDIVNRRYAETHFPCRMWEAGEKCLTNAIFRKKGRRNRDF